MEPPTITAPSVRVAGAVLSGGLLALPFLSDAVWPVAWLALVPLLLAVRGQPARLAFLLGWVAGATFFGITLYWLITFGIAAWLATTLFLGLHLGAFGAGLAVVNRQLSGPRGVLAAAALWTALEVVRSSGMLGFPWALLGSSQVSNLLILQLASVGGPFAISFALVLANAALAALASNGRGAWGSLAVAGLALLLAIGYGSAVAGPARSATLRAAAVQPNVSVEDKVNPFAAPRIIERLELLIGSAASTRPDLIILPETAVPGDLFTDPRLLEWVRRQAQNTQTVMIAGTFTTQWTNTAVAMSPQGALLGRYDKVRLVAFGERGVNPGREFRPLRTPVGTLGVAICFESAFPQVARALVQNGAELLVVITNDGWFGPTAAPFQHAALARLRAVETRRFVITAANTGVSNIIDPYGRVVAATGIFHEGVLRGDVALDRRATLYSRFGGFVDLMFVGLGLLLFARPAATVMRRHRNDPNAVQVVLVLLPGLGWAVVRLLAPGSGLAGDHAAPLALAMGTLVVGRRIGGISGVGRAGLVRSMAAAGVAVGTVIWLLITGYAGKGLPLAVGPLSGIAVTGLLLLAPVAAEDIWLRGLVFGTVQRWQGWAAALLATAGLSALWHAGSGPEGLLLGLLMGVLFGLIRVWSGNVLGLIAAHALLQGFLRSAGLL